MKAGQTERNIQIEVFTYVLNSRFHPSVTKVFVKKLKCWNNEHSKSLLI